MKISIDDKKFRIELSGLEKFGAMKIKPIEVSLENIVDVSTEKPEFSWRTLKFPGAYIPGVIGLGTYYTPNGREFWNFRRKKSLLTLELKDEKYARIVLELDNNKYWADMLGKYC